MMKPIHLLGRFSDVGRPDPWETNTRRNSERQSCANADEEEFDTCCWGFPSNRGVAAG